jgi:pSer/pThr/pTyr-binding forkhead associated (FHA) protein
MHGMESTLVRIIFRHITGSRATEVDVVPLGPHRELILGRASSAAVRFDPQRDASVGRHHARIEPDATPGTFRIVDLGSHNGTLLNGRRVLRPMPLTAGDIVRLGEDGPELEILVEQISLMR